MGKLTCLCLNVKINTKQDPKLLGDTELDKLKKAARNEVVRSFTDNPVSEVILNLEGIHIEHPRLVFGYDVADWKVYQCLNCGICCHASSVSRDEGNILVSSSLLDWQKAIDDVMTSPEYSPVYKIVLQNGSVSSPVSFDSISSELKAELEVVQKQLNAFLVSEESAMEERIRLNMQSERDQYARLQSQARNHKNILVSRLLMAGNFTPSDSLCDEVHDDASVPQSSIMAESPLQGIFTIHAEASSPSPFDIAHQNHSLMADITEEDQQDDVLSPLPSKSVSRSNSDSVRRQVSSGTGTDVYPVGVSKDFHPGHIPIDDVFQFDPGFQEDPNMPFSDSDDEVDDTDDSSQVDDGIQRGERSALNITSSNSAKSTSVSGYSTSVPINIPAWGGDSFGQAPGSQYYYDNDDVHLPQDAESMAASIKALARSVHGNTSEIFGELPKPPTRARVASTSVSSRH